MAWSYRCDRADEVYNESGGPAVVAVEQAARPPGDGEGAIPEPEPLDEKARTEREKELREEMSELPAASGITAADLVVLERQRQDPEAGREVESPAKRLARESKLVNQTQELETQRKHGEELQKIRLEERNRVQDEEREKALGEEREKIRKEEQDKAKKEQQEREKTQREQEKTTPPPKPQPAQPAQR